MLTKPRRGTERFGVAQFIDRHPVDFIPFDVHPASGWEKFPGKFWGFSIDLEDDRRRGVSWFPGDILAPGVHLITAVYKAGRVIKRDRQRIRNPQEVPGLTGYPESEVTIEGDDGYFQALDRGDAGLMGRDDPHIVGYQRQRSAGPLVAVDLIFNEGIYVTVWGRTRQWRLPYSEAIDRGSVRWIALFQDGKAVDVRRLSRKRMERQPLIDAILTPSSFEPGEYEIRAKDVYGNTTAVTLRLVRG